MHLSDKRKAGAARRTTAYLAAALASIAVVIGVKQGFFTAARQPAPSGTDPSVITATPAQATSRAKPVARSSNVPSESPPSFSEERDPSRPKSTSLTAMARQSNGDEPQTPSSVDAEASDATAVIGRPFPVSNSVEAGCRRFSGSCDEELEGLLSKFAQEQRDLAWATDMEAKLRDHIMTAEPNKFSIRAIECRATRCVVEVASLYGPLLGAPYSFVESNNLYNGLSVLGYEANEHRARITVTLQTFERR